jgi:DNA-binding NarL/FixJ family response regulator
MTRGPIGVLIVADDDVLAARTEAALHGDEKHHVRVGHPRSLVRLLEEEAPAVIVLAAATHARAAAILETLSRISNQAAVALLAGDPHAGWTSAARRAGVRAVLHRQASADELSAAVRAVSAGLIVLHQDVFRAPAHAAATPLDEERALTPRELEILEMLAEGLSNQTIGRRLHISTHTVKFHVAAILSKLEAGSRTEAVTHGVRRGLISL